ncbi:hypothetical protein PYCCODRAFT_1242133 [Trametes coccinea BRFM310]|uniref:Uncharacterized protein n=1 Tax=Trametes coccinea (strain BRFM310) TaxID=1353009 RepID=A0A1Y2IZ41_TRAC3|nr:hypothetical protein PYCCODRAFT_1242133 [Trametes coccinea BRFM310]
MASTYTTQPQSRRRAMFRVPTEAQSMLAIGPLARAYPLGVHGALDVTGLHFVPGWLGRAPGSTARAIEVERPLESSRAYARLGNRRNEAEHLLMLFANSQGRGLGSFSTLSSPDSPYGVRGSVVYLCTVLERWLPGYWRAGDSAASEEVRRPDGAPNDLCDSVSERDSRGLSQIMHSSSEPAKVTSTTVWLPRSG